MTKLLIGLLLGAGLAVLSLVATANAQATPTQDVPVIDVVQGVLVLGFMVVSIVLAGLAARAGPEP